MPFLFDTILNFECICRINSLWPYIRYQTTLQSQEDLLYKIQLCIIFNVYLSDRNNYNIHKQLNNMTTCVIKYFLIILVSVSSILSPIWYVWFKTEVCTLVKSLNILLIVSVQLDPERSLFDQGVKTDGTVQLSVQVISYQGKLLFVAVLSLGHDFLL